ncbi:MAG: hypothetical protein P1P64_02630 [Treponemataceae bacterium]
MRKFIFIILAVFSVFTFAQETYEDLEAELFDEDDLLIEPEDATSEKLQENAKLKTSLDEASILLETEKIRFGGMLNSGLSLNYSWDDPYSKKADYTKAFTNPEFAILQTILAAQLFFDARPSENSKIYSKFDFGFPFEKDIGGVAKFPSFVPAPYGNALLPTISSGVPNFKVRELYTDFSAKDIAFFRFGKHVVKWGAGYFYSPADILNISRIDPQDPEAEREGPVSLRLHIIVPKKQHNFWFYLLPPTKTDDYKPQYTAGAGKAEFVFGNWELGFGGFYKYKKAPRLITTLSGNIDGNVRVFAEGVFAWGSDYTYYKTDGAFTEYTEKNKAFFQATLGGSYTNTKSKSTIALQYYYNGFGYQKPYDLVYPLSATAKNETDPAAMQAAMTLGNIMLMPQLGQHYIALNFHQGKLGTEKLSLNIFQQFAISEREGLSALKLNYDIYKFVSMDTGLSFTYPISKDSKSKGSIGWSLGVKLGGGKF